MKHTETTKIKHATGIYLNLPDSPNTEDIIYYLKSKKLKTFKTTDLITVFGESKREKVLECISELKLGLKITTTEELGTEVHKLNA